VSTRKAPEATAPSKKKASASTSPLIQHQLHPETSITAPTFSAWPLLPSLLSVFPGKTS